jgi:hypothetical protein
LDVSLHLAGVQGALKPSVLDRAAKPDVVQVDPVVAAVVVVDRAGVLVAVPGPVDLGQAGRPVLLDLGEEVLVDAPAPAAPACGVDPQGVLDESLLLVDDLDQVAQRLGVEACGVDVDVDPAAAVDPCPSPPDRPDDLLDRVDVRVGEDGAN